ncbi:hypothetical protein ACOMHN_007070 [Nucella lapillus]
MMALNRRYSSRRNRVAPVCVVTQSESEGEVEGEGENVVSLVHQAASRGDTRQLVQVVQRDPSLLEQPNADGMTPLGQAVMSQQMTAVKRLVKMGADINAQDGMGRTSLSIAAYQQMTAVHWAAFHKRPEHVRHLIERGTSLLLADMDGKLPLHWAAQNGCRETCRLLLHASTLRQGVQPRESPGEGKKPPRGEMPLPGEEGERDQMLTAQDHSGKTALHFAAAAGHAEVIRQLAFYLACQPDSPDPDDRTPLHWAAAMGHVQCVQVLLNLGVKANVKDMDGGTPIFYAKQSAHNDCVHLLEQVLNIPAGESSTKNALEEGRGGGKKGKNPLEFLKGLFLSPRKDNSGSHPSRRLKPPPNPLLASPKHPGPSPPPSSPVRPPNSPQGISLPSIRAKPGPHTAGADVSGNAYSSHPVSDVSATLVECPVDTPDVCCWKPEQVEEKMPVRGEKLVKYRATHIPALPPLLPDDIPNSSQRESGFRTTVSEEQRPPAQDLGPLRLGPPPRTRCCLH